MWKYLKSRAGVLIVLGVITLVFCLMLALYKIPYQAALYAGLICFILLIIIAIVDFMRFRARKKRLEALLSEIPVSVGSLPEPQDAIEEMYQSAVRLMRSEFTSYSARADEKYAALLDYYTMWAHQIKTPIAAMRLILQTEDAPRGAEISEELRRVEQYAEMVMCYLRVESESTDYVIRVCELDNIIRQAVRKFASQFIRRKIALNFTETRARVLTDEKWLSFILEQVISNALKYTPSGEVAILMPEPDTLVIRDTGIGIDKADLARVFERGYTGANGRLDKRASGIGLFLSKRVAKRLNISLSAHAREGGGAEIRIAFPPEGARME